MQPKKYYQDNDSKDILGNISNDDYVPLWEKGKIISFP